MSALFKRNSTWTDPEILKEKGEPSPGSATDVYTDIM